MTAAIILLVVLLISAGALLRRVVAKLRPRNVELDLRRALQARKLSLVYQPKIDGAGRLCGVEALVRWHDRQRGTIAPEHFIAVAEQSGLIVELDEWVLDEACRQLAEWRAAGLDVPGMSVNTCATDFSHADYPGLVARALRTHGLAPADLTLEITERVLLDASDNEVCAALEAIDAFGVTLSVDDFGTGFSTPDYIRSFPVRELKLDKRFVQGIGRDTTMEFVAEAVLGVRGALRLTVAAEGVETEAQRAFLARHGCRVFQGNLYAPPMSPDDFARWAPTRIHEAGPRQV